MAIFLYCYDYSALSSLRRLLASRFIIVLVGEYQRRLDLSCGHDADLLMLNRKAFLHHQLRCRRRVGIQVEVDITLELRRLPPTPGFARP